MNKIIILNGPNLNLLGEREKNQYGNITLKDIEEKCSEYANKNDIKLSMFQSNIEGELVEKIQNNIVKLKVAPWTDEESDMGPVISKEHKEKIENYISKGQEEGAKLVLDGRNIKIQGYENGHFVGPTLFDHVSEHMTIYKDEIFGPVAAIQTFVDEDEIIERSNSTEYGLVAYLYTEDVRKGLRLSEKLEFGMIGLNRGLVSDPAAPFGGVKQSGLGREGGKEGLLEFQETQYISTEW